MLNHISEGHFHHPLSAASSVSPLAVDVPSSHRPEFARHSGSVNAVEGRAAREGVLIAA